MKKKGRKKKLDRFVFCILCYVFLALIEALVREKKEEGGGSKQNRGRHSTPFSHSLEKNKSARTASGFSPPADAPVACDTTPFTHTRTRSPRGRRPAFKKQARLFLPRAMSSSDDDVPLAARASAAAPAPARPPAAAPRPADSDSDSDVPLAARVAVKVRR